MKVKHILTAAALAACALLPLGITRAEAASLTAKDKNIVTISALAAQGDLPRLSAALHTALDQGMTVNEAKEILIQLYAYAGFPRSLNGLNTLIRVTDERAARGIHDTMGPEANTVDMTADRYAIGQATQTRLVGHPLKSRLYDEFAPTISTFLKEHLFYDIFERGLLTPQERELATVGFLSGIGNVNPQLAGHMQVSLNVGITREELQEAIQVLEETVSSKTADNAETVFQKLTAPKA